MKKLFSKENLKKDIFALGVVFLLAIPSFLPLLSRGYFPMHDDMQVIRLQQMEKCFLDGQIPCRWSPDLGAGFGQPMFNYYSAFPYYLGIFFRIFGLQFVDIVKLLFLLSLALSGIFMYFLGKEFFGKLGGITAAVFYIYAPYHAVDIYVRGALAESWAITFFPLVFWLVYKLVKEGKPVFFVGAVLSLFLVFTSHNVMTLIFTPFVILWSFFILAITGQKRFKEILLFFLWSFCLSAFFLLPAFVEKKFVLIDSLTADYFDFRLHFASKKQLFWSRHWGFGGSLGPDSDMSLQIGWLHWLFSCFSLLALAIFFVTKKIFSKKDEVFYSLIFFSGLFLVSVFFTHRLSLPFWENLPFLSYAQFPWRFLALVIFSSSFLAGFIPFWLKNKIKGKPNVLVSLFIILSVIVLNYSYFKPQVMYRFATDDWKLSGEELDKQKKSALFDYLPKQVKNAPSQIAPESPWVVSGEADIFEFEKRTNFFRMTIDAKGNQPARVGVPVFDFPNWEIFVDQKKVPHNSENKQGVIEFEVGDGKHTVVGWFRNTWLRDLANAVTLFSFGSLIVYFIVKEER